MKKNILLAIGLISAQAYSQTGNVGINTSAPNANAALDIVSMDKGLLPPRIALTSTTAADPLTAHVAGMVVYNTATTGTVPTDVSPGYYFNTGIQWVKILDTSQLSSLSIPRPAAFQLNSTITNFLSAATAGETQNIPMDQIANVVDNGISFNAATSTITFTPGLYAISVTYEASHNASGCTISSYFEDFPTGSSPSIQRIHNTASHVAGAMSNHGGSINFTTRITANYPWVIRLGRGQSGNCTGAGMSLVGKSTQISILRIAN